MPDNCRWCNTKINSGNDNGVGHCRKPDCRTSEIDSNIDQLLSTLILSSKHIWDGKIEIRSPGNDGFGAQLKLTISYSNEEVGDGFDIPTQDMLKCYFREMLFSGTKGNLIIDIVGGKFNGIQSEFFVQADSPRIFTGNKIVNIMNSNNRGGLKNVNDKR